MFWALCFCRASSNFFFSRWWYRQPQHGSLCLLHYIIGVNSFTIPSDMHSASLISPISVRGGDVKRTHVYITTPTPLDGYIYKFACGHTVYLDCGRAGKPGPPSVATSVRKEKGGNCFCATNTLHCCTHFRLWHTYRTAIGFPTVFYLFPTLASSVKLFGCFVCLFVWFPFEKNPRLKCRKIADNHST